MSPAPAVIVLLAYGAGLATGLLHFEVLAAAFSVPVAVLAWSRWPQLSHTVLLLLLGTASGSIARAAEESACTHRLPVARMALRLRLSEPVSESGGRTLVTPLRAGCQGAVAARWPTRREGKAGDEWKVHARWVPPGSANGPRRGTLVVETADLATSRPRLADRLRNSIIATTQSLYGNRAPLVDALILNRRTALDPVISDAYARSGLVHILSISGFHVGLIAGWLYLLSRMLRMGRSRAMITAAGASTLYVAFLGWPAPATRAAALVVLLALCRWRQRQVEPNALLAATCLVVALVDPTALFDLGAWLSAAALWGATTFSRWTDRAVSTQPGWRMLGSSIGATLATAPLTAALLGSVAPIGILLNFAAIPLAALAVPGVLASVVIHPVAPGVASALAAGSGAGLSLLDGIALLGSKVPGGSLVQPVAFTSGVPWVIVLALVLWSTGKRNTLGVAARRWSWAVAGTVWASVAVLVAPVGRDKGSALTLHFLQVGQGDGAAVRTPGGRWVIIDAGPRFDGADAGHRVVVPFLRRQGVRHLSAVIVSHVHADHLGGVPAVLARVPADVVVEPGALSADPRYLEFLNQLESEGIRWHPGRTGDRFELDSVVFSVLHPDTTWAEWGADLNEDSIVLLISYRNFSALFTGDAGERAEPLIVRRSGTVDLLKVGHHGSRTATTDELLTGVRPKAAVISVGSNTYGHPSPAAVSRLRSHQVPFWRTDQDGEITVQTDGHLMTVCAARGCNQYRVDP